MLSASFKPFESLLSTLGSFRSSPNDSDDLMPLSAHSHVTAGVLTAPPGEEEARERKEEDIKGDTDYHVPREYIQDAGQTLPELATELVQAQNSQNKELRRREEELRNLQNELEKEHEKQRQIQSDICAASKAICLCQEETSKLTALCSQLERGMASFVTETGRLSHKLRLVEQEAEDNAAMFKQYRSNMEEHRESARMVEQGLPVQQELDRLQLKIAELKERRGSYISTDGLQVLSGEKQRTLSEKCRQVKNAYTQLLDENEKLRTEIQHLQQKRSQLQCSVEVGRKRRQAQLTRLHHQLQEAQARRRQWAEEVQRMRRTITSLKQTVEE